MTFGEKLKKARIDAGFTQSELANVLMVSRAAIAKWESDRGIPEVSNLKQIAEVLGVSIDYLLDDESAFNLSVTTKPLDFSPYEGDGKLSRLKKVELKERVIREEYPNAEIVRLTLTDIKDTKTENIVDKVIGTFAFVLGNIPLYGTQEFGKMANSFDQQYYLVSEEKAQYFVLMTDEQIISRMVPNKITEKTFNMDDKRFLMVGNVE
jgi:transcriptional regulator with XRE-family HTH domain